MFASPPALTRSLAMAQMLDWHIAVRCFPNHVEFTLLDSELRLWLRCRVPLRQWTRCAQQRLAKAVGRQWERTVTIAISVDAPLLPLTAGTSCKAAPTRCTQPARRDGSEARAPPPARPRPRLAEQNPPVADRRTSRRRPPCAPSSAQLQLFGRDCDHGEDHDFQ